MRRVLISMEKKITDRGLDVDADIPDSGIMVLGDNDLITQVIYNLLENAAKFARKGSALYLGVTTLNGKALISVRNEGDTIPAEEIPLLFERFHKSDKSRSEDKDGVGLGLYVVKTILDQHKGAHRRHKRKRPDDVHLQRDARRRADRAVSLNRRNTLWITRIRSYPRRSARAASRRRSCCAMKRPSRPSWSATCSRHRCPDSRRSIHHRAKKRKGLKIFLFCMLGLLLVSGVVTALWLGGAFDDHRSYHDDDFEQRHDEDYYDNSEHGETTIKRLPNTDQVKLRYNESHGEALTIREIYQKVNPSTVTVLTGNRDGSAMVGTGVIFTEDGYILTNAHVIAGGSECYVVLDTGEDYRACLLGLDEEKRTSPSSRSRPAAFPPRNSATLTR